MKLLPCLSIAQYFIDIIDDLHIQIADDSLVKMSFYIAGL